MLIASRMCALAGLYRLGRTADVFAGSAGTLRGKDASIRQARMPMDVVERKCTFATLSQAKSSKLKPILSPRSAVRWKHGVPVPAQRPGRARA